MASLADKSKNSQRTSERFNAPDADVIIKSSDNTLFSVHRKYLAATTGGFPPMEIEPAGETTELTEDSTTLELLFQFVYPQRHPTLSDTPYEVAAPLAEAAEKYEVFAAMNICQIRMANFLPAHAEGILAYAAKHGYHDIMDIAAPLVVPLPARDSIRLLPQHLVAPWVIYREQWYDILIAALSSQPHNKRDTTCNECFGRLYCDDCAIYPQSYKVLTLVLNIRSLSSLDELTNNTKGLLSDTTWTQKIDSWIRIIKAKVEAIQKFSTFI